MHDQLPPRLADRFKALLLVLLAIVGFQQFASGRLHSFITPRLSWLIWLTTAFSILIAASYNLARPRADDSDDSAPEPRPTLSLWALLLLALPVILALTMPALPLDARTLRDGDLAFRLPPAADEVEALLARPPADRSLLDWVRIYDLGGEPSLMAGQSADVSGFVYRSSALTGDQFIVARYTLRCCFAGAQALGLIVETEDAGLLVDNTWVQVIGTWSVGEYSGEPTPVVLADQITIIEPPEEPYLFP